MLTRLKRHVNTIILILLYTVGIQIVSQSILYSKIDELENSNIQNIDLFLFVINLLIVIFSVLFIFFQSCLYKIFLVFFQFDKTISFMRNFSHVLKGTMPFVIVCLIYEWFPIKGNAFELLNQTFINTVNVIVTNAIYVIFLKRDLEISAGKAFIIGCMLVFFNLLFITISKFFISY
ncbi:hypothetical protein P4284_02370 [Bacillus swezeyi]|uniref:hypothetical protein n=1 Tax=Bacillus swezeyi TaxID=1925020 RepID=UPI002E206FEB|nr:hypothetical protein [Bacillus swezeyi]